MESTHTRRIAWCALILLTAMMAACGGSTQAISGTAPSLVSPVATATDNAGSFNLLKEGKGKGRAGTTPDPPETADADDDAGKSGEGHGHGKAAIQIEGFTDSIDGTCPKLTIVINDLEVTTLDTPELATQFQRATCAALKASTAPVHLHIAAKRQEDALVAIYVRMQGPKGDDSEDPDEEEGTTPAVTSAP